MVHVMSGFCCRCSICFFFFWEQLGQPFEANESKLAIFFHGCWGFLLWNGLDLVYTVPVLTCVATSTFTVGGCLVGKPVKWTWNLSLAMIIEGDDWELSVAATFFLSFFHRWSLQPFFHPGHFQNFSVNQIQSVYSSDARPPSQQSWNNRAMKTRWLFRVYRGWNTIPSY